MTLVEKNKKIEKKKKYRVPKGKVNIVGCPLCGDTKNLRVQGRCVTCTSCGWSTCSI